MTGATRPLAVAVVVAASVIAGCGGGDDGESVQPNGTAAVTQATVAVTEPTPEPTTATSPPAAATTPPTATTAATTAPTTAPVEAVLKVVTFNAGLARGFVDLADERVPLVVDAVAALDADLVALQEIWDPRDVDAVVAGVGTRFPERRFLDPAPESAAEPACPPGELDQLEPCARSTCAGLPDDQLAGCVLTSCGDEYAALCAECQTCLAANVGGSLDDVVTACTAAAERYAYGGSFGIGLLSRYPVLSWEETVFESSLNRRAVIHTVVDAGDLGIVHVFVTHLSPIFDDIPYPGDGTWEAEQRAQIEQLLALVAERVPADEPVVVLGDLNTGPALPGVAGEAPENFALLAEDGFDVPYVDATPSPGCTFCADNPLVGGADDDESVIIDHVLTRGLQAAAVDRVLDEPVTVGSSESRLSDHYGVSVTLRSS